MIEKYLHSLGFSGEEASIYINLWQHGPATAGRVAQRCGMTRTSVYGMLDRLVQKGVVHGEEQSGVARRFHAEPPGLFQEMFARRQRELAEAQESFHKILPQLYKKASSGTSVPRLTVYQGKSQLQNILGDMLLYQGIETVSLWPISLMVEMLGENYFRQHNIARIKRRIYTKAIWPEKHLIDVGKHPWLAGGPGFMREVRVAPSEFNTTMGYWVYGAQVAVLSSIKECFGFVIESDEFARMMGMQHMAVWSQSKPLHITAKSVTEFAAKYGNETERAKVKNKK